MRFLYHKIRGQHCDIKNLNNVLDGEIIYKISDSEIIRVDPQMMEYNDNLLFINGRIIFDGYGEKESQIILKEKIQKLNWPISNDASGYFSGFLINEGLTYIFNDPVGIYNLFYYQDEYEVIVATSISLIEKIKKLDIDNPAILLETVPPFVQYGTRTVLKGVKRLLPGELIVIQDFAITQRLYDFTIKEDDLVPSENFAEELVDLINSESKIFYDDSVTISISGGIDSRINLAPLIVNENKINAVNYGMFGCVDTDIPVEISREFRFNINVIDPTPFLFPPKELLHELIEKTDSLYVNSWHSILNVNGSKNDFFLLGDMLDILRAKSIKSLKSRKFRTFFYIKKFFFRKNLDLTKISNELIEKFVLERKFHILERAKLNLNYFNFTSEEEMEMLQKIESDIEDFAIHLSRYNFKYIESYEEFFELFTSGRLSMGKQLNILRLDYRAEIPLTNIKILRKVLNVAPNYRYADELTTKMFRVSSWKRLGKFPTSQNPLTSYNGNFYIMLLGWFLRSKTDYVLSKLFVLTRGKSKRNRLFKTYDHQKSYLYPNAFKNYKEYFPENNFCDFSEKIELFQKRKNSQSWPLSSMDLMPYAQAMYYISKFARK